MHITVLQSDSQISSPRDTNLFCSITVRTFSQHVKKYFFVLSASSLDSCQGAFLYSGSLCPFLLANSHSKTPVSTFFDCSVHSNTSYLLLLVNNFFILLTLRHDSNVFIHSLKILFNINFSSIRLVCSVGCHRQASLFVINIFNSFFGFAIAFTFVI